MRLLNRSKSGIIMTKYRKKPVVVEAIQWTGDNFIDIDEFITVPHETYPKDGIVKIPTLEGVMEAIKGDYIIKGVAGEFYSCKPEIFEATYEKIEGISKTTITINAEEFVEKLAEKLEKTIKELSE